MCKYHFWAHKTLKSPGHRCACMVARSDSVFYSYLYNGGRNLILYPRTLETFFLMQFYRCSHLLHLALSHLDLNTYLISHKCGSGCELAWPGWAKHQKPSEPQSHDPSAAAGSAVTQPLHSLNTTNRAASKRSIFSVQQIIVSRFKFKIEFQVMNWIYFSPKQPAGSFLLCGRFLYPLI